MSRQVPARGWQGVAAALVVGVVVGCLVVTMTRLGHERTVVAELQSRNAVLLNEQSVREALVAQLTAEHDVLLRSQDRLVAEMARLEGLPPKVLVRGCEPRATPIFESRYTVGR